MASSHMREKKLRSQAQRMGIAPAGRHAAAQFIKPVTEFCLSAQDLYAHNFDELNAFYTSAAEHQQCRTGTAQSGRIAQLSPVFNALWPHVLPGARRHLLRLFWGLSLHRQHNLALAVARLVALDAGRHSLSWCTLAAKIRPNRRAVFITLLAETGLGATAFSPFAATLLLELETLTVRRNYAAWLYSACQGILRGIDTNYLSGGFRIAHEYSPWSSVGFTENCSDFSWPALVEPIRRIRHSRSFYAGLPMTLWKACAVLPGFCGMVSQVCWRRFRPDHAAQMLHLIYNSMYEDLPPRKIQAKWQVFKRHFPVILEVIYRVPRTHKKKAIEFFEEYYWRFDDPELLEKYHHDFCGFVRRVCRAPFTKEDTLSTLWCTLLQCGPLSTAKGLLRLETYCRSRNAAGLAVKGIRALRKLAPEYSRTLLDTGNSRLLEIARLLGCTGRKQRYDILRAVRDSELTRLAVTQDNLSASVRLIDGYCTLKVQNPVPRKLKAFLQGKIRLSEKSLSGKITELNAKLTHFKTQVLEQSIRQSVLGHYGFAAGQIDDHALLLTNLIRENRRELRQFLSACQSGTGDYVIQHPATQRWIKKQPALDITSWQTGFEMSVEDAAVGTIRLAVEHDPLEKLKLGSYVGSCLGLGGSFTFSAAAVVLDFNKHVVYARDPKGRVVARQLVCLSDEGKLVPFLVYPVGTTKAMQSHFAEFDRRFAEALRIRCHNIDTDGEYAIANIISKDWWDDGAWNMQAED